MLYFEANSILSEKGKKASEAKIEFSVKYDLAFSIAKLKSPLTPPHLDE